MGKPPPGREIRQSIAETELLLQQGLASDALARARQQVAARPRDADARTLLGCCLRAMGETANAEDTFRAALKLDRGHEDAASALADLLDANDRPAESIRVLRAALAENRRSARLGARLANALTAAGQPDQALAITARLAAEARPDHAALHAHAAALHAAGQLDRAVAAHARATTLYPDSAAAHHNLAALHGDMGAFAEAERGTARALARGGDSAETWLVRGRALQGLRRLDEAEAALRAAIQRAPAYREAHRDLAQLVWMRTEDAGAALTLLDEAIRAQPTQTGLATLRASLQEYAGDLPGAAATLGQAIQRHPGEPALHIAAAHLDAQRGETALALRHAEAATGLLPDDQEAEAALCVACLATGDAARAVAITDGLVARRPLDQRALAYQAAARRLAGDARYREIYDYPSLVRGWTMDTPEGWPSLPAYLADLAGALDPLHIFRTHPLEQSLRHGSQASHLLTSDNPAIRAFPQAVDGPIRRHLAALGTGTDPIRSRNAGTYRFHGLWSVRLRPGGFHADHIHPQGWLSSACYIALPPANEGARASREAWIKFGEPGLRTVPALPAEHFVEPEPGLLVLFPSCMWHGTVPFSGETRRLSLAFDLVP